ncbi:hypothetical protein E2C01_007124 [Portunus trituberculatus]|uniref:Uncharacterized protein n=1 Tax=Portunus trituberculatus TaxID=210409 RepID=A0A5B7CYB8_PORTR|nr:hypothetical protein [Portunus trituberculatus]
MNRWYDGSEGGHSGLHQDYYNSMAQAMHCAYGNNMAGQWHAAAPREPVKKTHAYISSLRNALALTPKPIMKGSSQQWACDLRPPITLYFPLPTAAPMCPSP